MMVGSVPRWIVNRRRDLGRFRPKNRDFYSKFSPPRALELEIRRVDDDDDHDPNGYCSIWKKRALASLIVQNNLSRSVEIGVFKGSSFLPQAVAMRRTGGTVTGIDPYDMSEWTQEEGTDKMEKVFGKNWQSESTKIEWNYMYTYLLNRIASYGIENHCNIIRGLSHNVASDIEPGFHLLHIDGNHDYDAVAQDIELYVPLLADGGFLVLDDIDWPGVEPHYQDLKKRYPLVYEEPYSWGILHKT